MKKNKKSNLKIFIFIVILLVLFGYAVYKISTAVLLNYKNENTSENIINNVVEEKINNEIQNEVVKEEVNSWQEIKNSVSTNKSSVTNKTSASSTIYEQNNDKGSTDKKQEAISLVEKEWGKDSTVSFRCDSVLSNGEYVVAVVSKKTGVVQNYFKVNLETGEVEVDY